MRRTVWSCAVFLFTSVWLGACGNDGLEPVVGQVENGEDAGGEKPSDGEPGPSDTPDAGDGSPSAADDAEPSPEPEGTPSSSPSTEPDGASGAAGSDDVAPEPDGDVPSPGPVQDGGVAPSPTPEPEPSAPGPAPEPDPGPDPVVRVVPAIFRDFSEAHPDFGFAASSCGSGEAVPGMVATTLDTEGRPVLANASALSCVTSAETFAQWYRDGDNVTVMGELHLYDNGNGGFVNRFGPNGEPLRVVVGGPEETSGYGSSPETCATACEQLAPFELNCDDVCRPASDQVRVASDVYAQAELEGADAATLAELQAEVDAANAEYEACAAECAVEFDALVVACAADCKPCSFSPEQYCVGGEYVDFDGTPLFFPVDGVTGATADLGPARLPEQYGFLGWPWEADVFGTAPDHNFYFTTEVHQSFLFETEMDARLDFTGDDDLWVFVNGVLAIDLGGTHVPLDGSVTINTDTAATFDLEPGNVYDIAVFHAERMMEGSSFRLTLTGFDE